jgi:peptidoglycan/xylan/chitin deacetylase (PgdA/CDA1 family)
MKLFKSISVFLILVGCFSCSKTKHDEIKQEKQAFNTDFSDRKVESDVIDGLKFKNIVDNDSLLRIPEKFLEFQKNSNGFCLIKGQSDKKQIAFTFDDGPTEVSLQIIELLDKYQAKATFFWVGEKMKNNKSVIDLALKKGHLIANHSWNQPNGISFSNELLWESQVEKSMLEFTKFGIQNHTYYRPPFGAISQNQIDFLASKNVKTVLWSITTSDWDKSKNAEGMMFSKFKKELHKGAIVLLHDFDFGNLEAKLSDLENMLSYAKENGYQFVTIEGLE